MTAFDTPEHLCMSRRAMLASVGAAGAVVALAACGSSSPASGSSSGTGKGAAAGGALAKAADVPVGGAVSAKLDGAPIIVTQPTAGTFVGLTAVCTHRGCTVVPHQAALDCPCHGSSFSLDGAVTHGPATSPLATIALKVVGADVLPA